jgi:hypothetical protein
MNSNLRWNHRFWKYVLSIPPHGIPETEAPASGLADLEARLTRWGHLWSSDQASSHEAHVLVAERLRRWIDRCFGQHAHRSMSVPANRAASGVTMASSTPMFTAFLGRRATRELARSVLQDI